MDSIKYKLLMAALALPLLFAGRSQGSVQGVHVVNTPHNLSVSGGGGAHDQKATEEVRVCVFCHTPHHAVSDGPLWSRKSNLTIYTPYASTTIKANPDQPMGPSRLCLSCHDGTIAMGRLSGDFQVSTLGVIKGDSDPKLNGNFGRDLTTNHPVSMTYGLNPEFNPKASLEMRGIKLSEGTYVECTSCHDPHNNKNGNFLVKDVSSQHDALCNECHNKTEWINADNGHRTGGSRYVPEVSGPVLADGCISCHRPHNAQRGAQLLKLTAALAGEETNCVGSCHKGSTYSVPGIPDIVSQFAKPYTHPLQNYPGIHVEDETIPVQIAKKHVQCVDCHNPHQAGWQGGPLGAAVPSTAPAISGALRGVRGVAITGLALDNGVNARYEYEICLKCHAGSSFTALSAQRPVRLYSTYNQTLRFAPGNPSYHPVTTDTVGLTGRSLKAQYQNNNMPRIYCSNCHATHGSDYPHILLAENGDTFPSGQTSYALCFSCHNDQFLLNPLALPVSGSVNLHRSHVRDHMVPCSACHDPHGTPSARGANSNNAAHLMNFDTNYTGAAASYNLGARSCTVAGTCHTGSLTQPQTY